MAQGSLRDKLLLIPLSILMFTQSSMTSVMHSASEQAYKAVAMHLEWEIVQHPDQKQRTRPTTWRPILTGPLTCP